MAAIRLAALVPAEPSRASRPSGRAALHVGFGAGLRKGRRVDLKTPPDRRGLGCAALEARSDHPRARCIAIQTPPDGPRARCVDLEHGLRPPPNSMRRPPTWSPTISDLDAPDSSLVSGHSKTHRVVFVPGPRPSPISTRRPSRWSSTIFEVDASSRDLVPDHVRGRRIESRPGLRPFSERLHRAARW
jgi:hypothetical protein